MDDGSGEGDYRRPALVSLRPDPEHRGCDIFTRRFQDIYSRRLHPPGPWPRDYSHSPRKQASPRINEAVTPAISSSAAAPVAARNCATCAPVAPTSRPRDSPKVTSVSGRMESTDHQRWARVPPHLARKRPGMPTEWTRVLERNEEAMNPEPLEGYVWLQTPGKAAPRLGGASRVPGLIRQEALRFRGA